MAEHEFGLKNILSGDGARADDEEGGVQVDGG